MAARNLAGRAGRSIATAGLLAVASVALFWPGFADFDTVSQYDQVLSGEYRDWHPPAMARLWGLLHALFGDGAGPMLVAQIALYWLGLGLIAGGLARAGRPRAGAAVLVIGAWPVFLGWQGHVLKDAQMAGAALAATGLVAWWRLAGRRVPGWGWTLAAMLLCYGDLVRANAVFALAPLVVAWTSWTWRGRVAGAIGLIAVTILLAGPINHRLLGAAATGVERTEPIYDLAGIAVRVADPRATGLDAGAVRTLTARRCVKPFFWDPLGDPDACDRVVQPLRDLDLGRLYAMWVGAIVRHPLAYAAHRFAHLNSTERWLVPTAWPSAAPPAASEPNDDGLATPHPPAIRFERLAGWCAETPLGWPIVFVVIALGSAGIALRRPSTPVRDVALALLASALGLEASFAVLSIASDLRYHLWPMLATALACVIVLPIRPGEARAVRWAICVLVLVIAAGLVARATLPPAPATYAGMIAA